MFKLFEFILFMDVYLIYILDQWYAIHPTWNLFYIIIIYLI